MPFMKPATMEALIWVLIFGGLLVLSLSWFIDNTQVVLAASLAIGGALATVLGVLLIFIRSRQGSNR
jgi:hypothetical protein